MAARKKKAAGETGKTVEQMAVSETVKGCEETAEPAAVATGEAAAKAEIVKDAEPVAVTVSAVSAQVRAFPWNRTLKYGADGDDVRALQTALRSAGLDVAISGVYDLRTVRAVQQLQRNKGLAVSAVIGKHDYAILLGYE